MLFILTLFKLRPLTVTIIMTSLITLLNSMSDQAFILKMMIIPQRRKQFMSKGFVYLSRFDHHINECVIPNEVSLMSKKKLRSMYDNSKGLIY